MEPEKKNIGRKPEERSTTDTRRVSTRGDRRGGPLANKPLKSVNYTRILKTGLKRKEEVDIPPLKDGDIRILILGGVEEIGVNMSAIEYKDTIIIVDCGFIFSIPELPGINYLLPNTKYLEDNKHKIKGMVLTHGHLDHIGAIPFLIERLGYPPIYSRRLTNTMVEKRQRENQNVKPLKYNEIEMNSRITFDENLSASFFAVTHTIPDSMGIIFETKLGDVVFTGDLKVEHKDGVVLDEEYKEFKTFKDRKVLLVLADSTNAERPGFSVPENRVIETIDELFSTIKGRIIMGSFASQIERNIKMIKLAEKYGRKVVIEGRSMKDNLRMAIDLGLLKIGKNHLIPVEEVNDYPPEKIVAFVTGSQGEEYSALWRMAKKQHNYIKLNKRDTIIFSSSVIPGNERSIQTLKDKLSRQDSAIITYQTSDVHSSGHAGKEELRWIHQQINARFLVPLHGYHYMLTAHAALLKELGMSEDNIILPSNGSIIEIREEGKKIVHLKHKMPSAFKVVDGNAIGEIQELVVRDRKLLAKDGIFVVIVLVNRRTKKVKKSPDIISRGFIYVKEEQELLQKIRLNTRRTTERSIANVRMINIEELKKTITKEVSSTLFHETNKKPIVIPVIFII